MSVHEQKSVRESSPTKERGISKDLQISTDSLSNTSVWMAKKQRSQIEKHIEIMKNRLALLMQEELKAKKKIMETKKKTNDMFLMKKMNYNQQIMRSKLKLNTDGNLEEKHIKSMDIREQQKVTMKNLKDDLANMKRQESEDIKKIGRENAKRLQEIKNQTLLKNIEKVNIIKTGLSKSRRKIEYYWEQKKRFYTEQHTLEALENEKTKENLEVELDKLEKVELELLEKIEKTQDLQNKYYDQYEEAFLMSASDVGGKEKKNETKQLLVHLNPNIKPEKKPKNGNNIILKTEANKEANKN